MSEIAKYGLTADIFIENVENELLKLASNFMNLDDVSTLKSSFLGYFTTSLAHVVSDSVFHRNTLHKERFLNTMSIPASIYNEAKKYEYTPALATSSQVTILASFKYDDLLNLVANSKDSKFVISKGSSVFLSGIEFVTFCDIDISSITSNTLECFYRLSTSDFPVDISNEFIRTFIASNPATGVSEIYLELKLIQATTNLVDFDVVNLNSLNNTEFTIKVPEDVKLCNIKVSYKATDADEAFTPVTVYFNENQEIDETEKACFYAFNQLNELSIYFPPATENFKPAYNSKLRVTYYTSLGSDGNFKFNDIALSTLIPELQGSVRVIENPSGGRNPETLLETKKQILNRVLSRDSIILEKDLEDYLGKVNDVIKTNGSLVKFVKYQDDLNRRLFNAFTAIYDEEGRVIPTNTATIELELADLEERGFTIRPGTVIIYDKAIRKYRLLYPNEFPDSIASDPSAFVYCVPFLLSFKMTPYPRLTYYINTVNQTIPLSTKSGSSFTNESFIVSYLNVQRNGVLDEYYTLELSMNSSLSDNDLRNMVIVRFIIEDVNGRVIGYKDVAPIEGSKVFSTKLNCTDKLDPYGKLIIENSLFDKDTDQLIPNALVEESFRVRLEVYYNGPEVKGPVVLTKNGIGYKLIRILNSIDNGVFYASLDHVMLGDLIITEDATVKCQNTPLVGSTFYLNPTMHNTINKVFREIEGNISRAFDNLHNNTSVNLKFYNTYGPSKYFNIERVNMSLAFDVKTNSRDIVTLKFTLQDAISKFVKESNSNTRSRFSISNLITFLERTFIEIVYIRFTGLNGSLTQNVELVDAISNIKQFNNNAPELLNVSSIFKNPLLSDPYEPDVRINFV